MEKMREYCQKNETVWVVTISGEPLGWTYGNGRGMTENDLKRPGMLPTEASAKRVARAFRAWIANKFPDKEEPKGQYFVAFADGPVKVFPSRKMENEQERRKNLNYFHDQGDAHLASQALAWLCERERERFESGVQSVQAQLQERQPGAQGDQTLD